MGVVPGGGDFDRQGKDAASPDHLIAPEESADQDDQMPPSPATPSRMRTVMWVIYVLVFLAILADALMHEGLGLLGPD
jgi:hypothetical protein